jgi:hypothetical protein
METFCKTHDCWKWGVKNAIWVTWAPGLSPCLNPGLAVRGATLLGTEKFLPARLLLLLFRFSDEICPDCLVKMFDNLFSTTRQFA